MNATLSRYAISRTSRLRSLALGAAWIVAGLSCVKPSAAKAPSQEKSQAAPVTALPAANIKDQPLLQLLQLRHTSRDFATRPIEAQMLSNLLWAAYGLNRPDGKRTAPSGHDWQYIDVYLADSTGTYRYEAKGQQLALIRPGDLRSKTGLQDFAATAPVSLIYVNDTRKFPRGTSEEEKLLFGATTAGAIAQNVYLFCAANHLNTGVRADIDRPALHAAMGLAPEQRILLAQSVGVPPGAK
jgi:hypothetical protein